MVHLIGSMIKTLFFDIGGVLIDIHPERTLQYYSDCTDIDINIIRESFPTEAHNNYELGRLTDHEWYLAVKENYPQPCCLKESDFYKGWKMLLGEEKPTLNLMEQLKDDYSIWLLSNTNPQHIRDEIDIRYEFPKHIDGAVYSFDVGYRKPHKSIYLRALELANSNAEHSLFIDDLKENIDAAKSVGMHGIHFQSVEQLEKDLIMMGLIPQKEALV